MGDVVIKRYKLYRRGGRCAWVWAYDVEYSGETFHRGPHLGSTMDWIKRYFGKTIKIIKDWER